MKSLDEKRDYLRVARTLRDKLDGLIFSGTTDLRTLRKKFLDVSQELNLVLADIGSCCKHELVLDPALWSTLPMELLQRVFATLPFSNICRLKSLSTEWQLSLQSSSSEFTLALKESSPRVLARVNLCGSFNFWLHILDGRNNRWHEAHVFTDRGPEYRRLTVSVCTFVHMNGAADAGLVCYVFKDFETGLNSIFVTNPMTGVVNPLPNLNLLMYSKLTMMRIVVDRDTYHYKVIVVKHAPPVEAEVYDSEVQQWTKPKPSLGRIFGIAHDWSRNEHSIRHESLWSAHKLGPCAYDCRDGKYSDFGHDLGKWSGKEVISYTLMKDRLFVLYWEQKEDEAFISEYCVPENATSWVKEETHRCFPRVFWPDGPELTGRIHACNGFLFVLLKEEGKWHFDADSDKKHEYEWVYDLSICEWRALPPVHSWCTIRNHSFLTNVMCELHWNIRP